MCTVQLGGKKGVWRGEKRRFATRSGASQSTWHGVNAPEREEHRGGHGACLMRGPQGRSNADVQRIGGLHVLWGWEI